MAILAETERSAPAARAPHGGKSQPEGATRDEFHSTIRGHGRDRHRDSHKPAGRAGGIMATSANASTTFLGTLPANNPVASTVPANGDVNPYGVAIVPRSTGDLVRGDVLVSNFNNLATTANPTGLQGLGTTILVQVSPTGTVTQFASASTGTVLAKLPRRRRRPHHRPGGAAQRLGDSRLAAELRRPPRRARPARLPDRPGQPRPRPRDVLRRRHQRPVGHDRARPRRHRRAIRHQRAERHHPAPGGPAPPTARPTRGRSLADPHHPARRSRRRAGC